ncbi:MAG: orotidine-5'-phosphate decarboxylase [Pseudomonadales bacterium]
MRILRAVARPPFIEQLQNAWQEQDTLLCVGLDPHISRLPGNVSRDAEGMLDFAIALVDAVASYVCAFKPQAAHFGAAGAEQQLQRLIAYIHEAHPRLPVILDAKRSDIGDTAALYALEAFERYGADAVTVNPFLGPESLRPYLAFEDRGVVVLCRTSNADSDWLQAADPADPAYLRIARSATQWNTANNVMLVTGATYPHELGTVRRAVGDMPLLVPGVGTQGGNLAEVIKQGCTADGTGLVINVSRSISQASDGDDFAQAAAAAAAHYGAQMRPSQIRLNR